MKIAVIGAGLAGCEAAYLLLKNGYNVTLFEMKPEKFTPAHKLPLYGELVCSNSLKTLRDTHPQGMLKNELIKVKSLIISKAFESRVPAGDSLAVNREILSKLVTDSLLQFKNLKIVTTEVSDLPESFDYYIVATGPLTTPLFSEYLSDLLGSEGLYFYDAIAPIVDYETIDKSKVFFGSRYGKGEDDFLNIPLTREEYYNFVSELNNAEKVVLRQFEEEKYYEGCLPIEVLAKRGVDTLAYGPLKPVGFNNKITNFKPYAIIQLRREDKEGTAYNIVGFQTKLTIPEQERVFRLIPGLNNVKFLRYGSIHRNTFINARKYLLQTLNLKMQPNIFFAGQITGVEGYVESITTGFLAALFLIHIAKGTFLSIPSRKTAFGALLSHLQGDPENFQPSGIHLGLFEKEKFRTKNERLQSVLENERKDFSVWFDKIKNLL